MILDTDFEVADFDSVYERVAERCVRWFPQVSIDYARDRVMDGNAVCLSNAEGFVVMALESLDGVRMRANVLLAASRGEPGAFSRHEESMLSIAADMGAQSLVFWTNRPRAWRRVLGPHWRLEGELFERTIMAIQPHQQRVLDEKRELDEKLEKLSAFIRNPNAVYDALIDEEKLDLTAQAHHMRRYSEILKSRIARMHLPEASA